MKPYIFFIVTLFSFAVPIFSQTPAAMTNANIVKLVKGNMDTDIILSKIQASPCKFNLTDDGLIALKKEGVPGVIIKAMLDKAAGTGKVAAGNALAAQDDKPLAPLHTVKAGLPAVTQLNYVHYLSQNTALPLEKALGSGRSKRNMITGSTVLLLEISGNTSSVKLSPATMDSFLINMGGNTLPDLVLYKLKTEKGKRVAVVGKLTTSGPKSGEDMMPIEFTKMAEGVYGIKPSVSLAKGEYFFTAKSNLNQSTSSSDVYAFTLQ